VQGRQHSAAETSCGQFDIYIYTHTNTHIYISLWKNTSSKQTCLNSREDGGRQTREHEVRTVAGSGNGGQQTRNEEHEVWTVVCSVQAVRIAAHFDDLQNIFLTYFGTEHIHPKTNI
jgi:hypothetical protein